MSNVNRSHVSWQNQSVKPAEALEISYFMAGVTRYWPQKILMGTQLAANICVQCACLSVDSRLRADMTLRHHM